jgi:pimeloyl-ACP methyl ester carboxylesterase
MAVDASDIPSFEIVSVVFLDIVPTAEQWDTFDNPKSAASKFHWSLLANVDIATKLITSYGGGLWCSEMMHRWAGRNEQRRARALDPEALAVYCRHFDKESVVRASCEDYRAGAFEDNDLQKKDQKAGNKIKIPTLVVYSEAYIGAAYDVESTWRGWCTKETRLETKGIGDGTGHFLPEEAPEETADIMNTWIKQWVK